MELKNAYIILGGDGTVIDNSKEKEYNYNTNKIASAIINNPTSHFINLCPLISARSALKIVFNCNSSEVKENAMWKEIRKTDEVDKKYVYVYSFCEDENENLIPIKGGYGIVNFELFSKLMRTNGIEITQDGTDEFVNMDYITESLNVPQIGIINKTLIEKHKKSI